MTALDSRYRGNRLALLGVQLSGGQMRVYSGLRPSSVAVPPYGNNFLLGVVPLGVFFADVGFGESTVNRVETGSIVAINTGVMRWARFESSGVPVVDMDISVDPDSSGVIVHSRVATAGELLFPIAPPSLSVLNGVVTEGSTT